MPETIYPNWFDGQKYNFEAQLSHLKGKPDLRFLQIGVYTGDASVWLLENILTDQSSMLIDVDTWEGSDEEEHKSISFSEVYEFYKKRMKPYENMRSARNNSDNFLGHNKTTYDFIYIDGAHTTAQVERDANGAWKLLKPNGILSFDDYLWRGGEDCPKPAIDKFLAEHEGQYKMLVDSYQIWIQKNDN